MSGWGIIPWGTGSWGAGGSSEVFTMAAARAINTHTVRVFFTAEPLHRGPAVLNDVLNPHTWTVQRLDNSQFFRVLSIVQGPDVSTWDVTVLQPLGPYVVLHRVETLTLLAADGATQIGIPRNAQFNGMEAVVVQEVRRKAVDFWNSPVPVNPVAGTMQITSAGDYKLVGGTALLKKLILRRMVTIPGEFFHLPQYGVGLREKDLIPGRDLAKLRTLIERQVALEPEVLSATARLNFQVANNLLSIHLTVRARVDGDVTKLDVKTVLSL